MRNFASVISLIIITLGAWQCETAMAGSFDTIDGALNRKNNNNKVDLLNLLAERSAKIKPDSSLIYSGNAAALARKTGNRAGLAKAMQNAGTAYEKKRDYGRAITEYSNAARIYNDLYRRDDAAHMSNIIGILYFYLGNYDQARKHYFSVYNDRENIKDSKITGNAIHNLLLLCKEQGDYNSAIRYAYELLQFWKNTGTRRDIADAYSYLGKLFLAVGDYQKSLESHIEELKMRDLSDDKEGADIAINNIAKIYSSMHKYDLAIKYYNISLRNFEEKGNKEQIARIKTRIGKTLYEMGDYQKSLIHYNEALKIAEEVNDLQGKAVLLNNIGLVYKTTGQYRQALGYCLKAIAIREQEKVDENIFYPLSSVAEICMNLNRYDDAINYADRAFRVARDNDRKPLIKEAYYLFYQIYSKMGKTKDALDYHLKFTMLKDSLINDEMNGKIAELQVKYETAKKDQENHILKKSNEAQLEKNKIQRNYFVVISALILLLMAVVINRYHQKQKANRLLSEMNGKILSQHDELEVIVEQLRESEEGLREANITKDKFFSIIAHDLKNPLQAIILSSDLLMNKFKAMTGEQLLELISNIHRSGNHLANLLQNLLQWARTQTGKIDFSPERVNIQLITADCINLLAEQAHVKQIFVYSSLVENTFVTADPHMLSTIIRNLLGNAIKFTAENGSIVISGEDHGDYMEVSVKDTGIGISNEDIDKLFRIDVNHTTIGTSKEKGTGLGLILTKEFVEMNHGRIWVESELNTGSKFTFTIPKH